MALWIGVQRVLRGLRPPGCRLGGLFLRYHRVMDDPRRVPWNPPEGFAEAVEKARERLERGEPGVVWGSASVRAEQPYETSADNDGADDQS